MKRMIENYINGNIATARRQARRHRWEAIYKALRDEYGYSERKARLTADHIKTGEGWQAACDAD